MDDGDGCGGQFFVLLEERALCSSNDSWSGSGTAAAGAPLPDQQRGKERDGPRDAAGLIDAEHASRAGGPGGRSIAPRSTREPSYYDEFDPLSGQTRDRLFFLDRLQEDRRSGAARMDGAARRAMRLAVRHGDRGLPTTECEWQRAAAAAAAAATLEEELDDERERFFEGDAADSERERDEHGAYLDELHRAACLRRTSGSFFKHQVGSGHAATTAEGLRDAAAAVYQCRRSGCHTLVDAGRARAAARKRPNGSFCEGDGCAGPRCATRWRPDRFVPRQCAMAYNLFHGRRRLADWPARVGGGSGTRRSRASGARAALLALAWLQELGLCSFEGPPTSSSSAP
jgi:hypothetical protein